MPTKSAVLDALCAIMDPDLQEDIVSAGFVTDLQIQDGDVALELELTSPDCGLKDWFQAQAVRHVRRVAGVKSVQVRMTARAVSEPSSCGYAAGAIPTPDITITEKALTALREAGLQDGDFLRIEVIAGGCSGNTYSAAIDDAMAPDDLILLETGPFRVITDPDSAPFLDGLQVDYSDDLVRSGFRFINPTASSSCGCGSSFEMSG